jgi:hypothetical protein
MLGKKVKIKRKNIRGKILILKDLFHEDIILEEI